MLRQLFHAAFNFYNQWAYVPCNKLEFPENAFKLNIL